MKQLMFKLAEKLSCELDKLAMYIVKDGSEYENHKMLFKVLDKISTSIYTIGYNKCVLRAKQQLTYKNKLGGHRQHEHDDGSTKNASDESKYKNDI